MKKAIHIISTGSQSLSVMTETMKAIHEDVDVFHLREKAWSAADLVQAGHSLVQAGVPRDKIMVNDRVDVAQVLQAKGVQFTGNSIPIHLVKTYYPSLRIGCSVHSLEEGLEAEKEGADYLLYGHIFKTSSKPGLAPRGVETLETLKQQVSIPVMAIGGITPENTKEVITAGADGIAVLSGVMLADDPKRALAAYLEALQ